MAKAGRPRKEEVAKLEEIDILAKLRIHQDYHQNIVIMDMSDLIPYSAFGALDTIFSKIGLVIKRQFGYMGFNWGYGAMKEKRSSPGGYGVLESPVSLHIYFQREIDDEWVEKKKREFSLIYQYLSREWELYKGITPEE